MHIGNPAGDLQGGQALPDRGANKNRTCDLILIRDAVCLSSSLI